MRKTWDEYFMDLAFKTSERATCPKRHVGAILVDKENHIISTGYNGSPPGMPHCDDIGCLEIGGRCKRTIHAEDNAIKRSNRRQRAGSKLYITDFPCLPCANLVSKSGIVEVIYGKVLSRSPKAVLALLEEEGIVVRRLDISQKKATSKVVTMVRDAIGSVTPC